MMKLKKAWTCRKCRAAGYKACKNICLLGYGSYEPRKLCNIGIDASELPVHSPSEPCPKPLTLAEFDDCPPKGKNNG